MSRRDPEHTSRSLWKAKTDALTGSSVNSGNPFTHSRKVVMSSANRASCSGNCSGSKSPVMTRVLTFGGSFDR